MIEMHFLLCIALRMFRDERTTDIASLWWTEYRMGHRIAPSVSRSTDVVQCGWRMTAKLLGTGISTRFS